MIEKRTFFVTAVTAGRRPIFKDNELARLFLSTLYEYRAAGRYALHAFVVMPDHVHCLVTPADTLSLERAIQLIKGGFSFRAGKLHPGLAIWEKSFTNHRIHDADDYERHVAYIHQNPVKQDLATRPSDYPYSSAHPRHALDPPPEELQDSPTAAEAAAS